MKEMTKNFNMNKTEPTIGYYCDLFGCQSSCWPTDIVTHGPEVIFCICFYYY